MQNKAANDHDNEHDENVHKEKGGHGMLWQALLLESQLIHRAVDGLMSPPPPPGNAASGFFATLAFAFAALAAVTVTAGVFLVIARTHTLPEAVLYTGLGMAGAAALAAGAAFAINRSRPRIARLRGRIIANKVSSLLEAASEEISAPVREYPKTAAALSALAGVLAGEAYGGDVENKIRKIISPR